MLMPGVFRLDLAVAWTSLDAQHDVEPSQYEPDLLAEEQPQTHVLDFELYSATLRLGAGLTERWNLEVELPLRETSIRARFDDSSGNEIPDFASIHHRTETISGVGDASLWIRTRLPSRGGWRFDLRGGVTVPTGDTEEDPFALGEAGKSHQHIFFGSGTWNPQLALGAARRLGNWGVSGWLRARVPMGRSSEGFQAGETATLGAQFGRKLGESRWSALLSAQVAHEEPSSWANQDARNSGRTDALLGAGLSWNSGAGWALQSTLIVPENLSAKGGQIDPAPVLSLGIARIF